MVNPENTSRLIKHLRSKPEVGFNMSVWMSAQITIYPDNSGLNRKEVGCLATHCFRVANGRYPKPSEHLDLFKTATSFLGLEPSVACDLIFPPIANGFDRKVTVEQTIQTLEHLMKTGEAKW